MHKQNKRWLVPKTNPYDKKNISKKMEGRLDNNSYSLNRWPAEGGSNSHAAIIKGIRGRQDYMLNNPLRLVNTGASMFANLEGSSERRALLEKGGFRTELTSDMAIKRAFDVTYFASNVAGSFLVMMMVMVVVLWATRSRFTAGRRTTGRHIIRFHGSR